MCSGGYMAPCEGDAWNWAGGQAWGTGFEQQQFDCNAWGTGEYQQQWGWDMSQGQKVEGEQAWDIPQGTESMTDQGWTMSEGPKVGAELLTELRLTELKRLIDRDAEALKKSSEGSPGAGNKDIAGVRDSEEAKGAVECIARPELGLATDTNAESAVAKAGGSVSGSADEDAIDTGVAVDRPEVTGSGAGDDVIDKAFSGDGVHASAASQAASPPGLAAPVEQCYVSLANFYPEGRTYGEMPVRAGDQIWVDSDPLEEWVFGFKRGLEPDQGWLPASFLGIDCLEDNDEWEDGEDDGRKPNPRQRRARATAKKGAARSEQEEWHSHGQWWSKQRHLNAQPENKEPQPLYSAAKAAARRPRGGHSRDAQRIDEENNAGRATNKGKDGKAQGRGREDGKAQGHGGGREREAAAQAEVDRPPVREKPTGRSRPALSALMDRLNKPLVAPKPSEGH